MSTVEINAEVDLKLDTVRAALAREISGRGDVCLTCSFQAEDVLLTKLALELDPNIPVLFLDTGYHFRETYEYRDRIAREWELNLINCCPRKQSPSRKPNTVFCIRSRPDQCCKLRKVEPLFKAVAQYRVWLTGLRREQARSRAAARGIGALYVARRKAGAQARAACIVDHARRLVRLRTTLHSLAAAL